MRPGYRRDALSSLSGQAYVQITLASTDTSKATTPVPETVDESIQQSSHKSTKRNNSVNDDMNKLPKNKDENQLSDIISITNNLQEEKADATSKGHQQVNSMEGISIISREDLNDVEVDKGDENETQNEQNEQHKRSDIKKNLVNIENKNNDLGVGSDDCDVIDDGLNRTAGHIATVKTNSQKNRNSDIKLSVDSSGGNAHVGQLEEAGNRDTEHNRVRKNNAIDNTSTKKDSINNAGDGGVDSPDDEDNGKEKEKDHDGAKKFESQRIPRVKVRDIDEVKLFLEHFTVPLGKREMFYTYLWRPVFLLINIFFIFDNYFILYDSSVINNASQDDRQYHLQLFSRIIAHTEFYVLMVMILVAMIALVLNQIDKSVNRSPVIVDCIREMGRWSGFKLSYILRPEGIRGYLADIYANSSLPYSAGRKNIFIKIEEELQKIIDHKDQQKHAQPNHTRSQNNNDSDNNRNSENSENIHGKDNKDRNDNKANDSVGDEDCGQNELKSRDHGDKNVDNGDNSSDNNTSNINQDNNNNNDTNIDANTNANNSNDDDNNNNDNGGHRRVKPVSPLLFDFDIENDMLVSKITKYRRKSANEHKQIPSPTVHQEFIEDVAHIVLSVFIIIGVCIGFCAVILKLSQFTFITDKALVKWQWIEVYRLIAFSNQVWGIVNMENVRRSSLFEFFYVDIGSLNQMPSITRNSRFHIMAMDCVIKQGLTEQGFRGKLLAVSLPYSVVLKILLKNPYEDDLMTQIVRKERFREEKRKEYEQRQKEKLKKKQKENETGQKADNAYLQLQRSLSSDNLVADDVSPFKQLKQDIFDVITSVLEEQVDDHEDTENKRKININKFSLITFPIYFIELVTRGIVNSFEKTLPKISFQLPYEDFKDHEKSIWEKIMDTFKCKNLCRNEGTEERYGKKRVQRGSDYCGNVKLWQARWLFGFRRHMSHPGFLRVDTNEMSIRSYKYDHKTQLKQPNCTCGEGNDENIIFLPLNASGHASFWIDKLEALLLFCSTPFTILIMFGLVIWELLVLFYFEPVWDGYLDVNGIAEECVVTGKDQADNFKTRLWTIIVCHWIVIMEYIWILYSWAKGAYHQNYSLTDALLNANPYINAFLGFFCIFGYLYGWLVWLLIYFSKNRVCVTFDFAIDHYQASYFCMFINFHYGWVLFAAGVQLIVTKKGYFWLIAHIIALPFQIIIFVILMSVWRGGVFTLISSIGVWDMDGCFFGFALSYCITSIMFHVLFVLCVIVDYDVKSKKKIQLLGWHSNVNNKFASHPLLALPCIGKLKDDGGDDIAKHSGHNEELELKMSGKLKRTSRYYRLGAAVICLWQLTLIIFWHVNFHSDFGFRHQCTSDQIGWYNIAAVYSYILLIGWCLSWISVQCMWYQVVNKKKLKVCGIPFTIRQFLATVAGLTLKSSEASRRQSKIYQDQHSMDIIVRTFGTERLKRTVRFIETLQYLEKYIQRLIVFVNFFVKHGKDDTKDIAKKLDDEEQMSQDSSNMDDMKKDMIDEAEEDVKQDEKEDDHEIKHVKTDPLENTKDTLKDLKVFKNEIRSLELQCSQAYEFLLKREGFIE